LRVTSYVLTQEQASWAVGGSDRQRFTLVILETALDLDRRMCAFISYTVPCQAIQQLAVLIGGTPDGTPVVPRRGVMYTEVSEEGVHFGLDNFSSGFLLVPHSQQPFISVWVPEDVGWRIAREYSVAS
jgi:hypothetical protein